MKCMNIKYHYVYYIIIWKRVEEKFRIFEYENNECDYIIHDDLIIPNYDIGVKPPETRLRYRILRSQI